MRDKRNSKSLLSTEQDARISTGISRGKKSGKKKWSLVVRLKGLLREKAEPLGLRW